MLTFKSLKFKFAALNLHIQEYVEFANSLEGTLVLRKPLDFESERQLNVSIRAQDQGNPPLYNETYVIIRVQDADDQNPLFSRPRYVAYLPQPAVKVIHLCKFLDLNTGNCFNCSHWSRSSTWFFYFFFLKNRFWCHKFQFEHESTTMCGPLFSLQWKNGRNEAFSPEETATFTSIFSH